MEGKPHCLHGKNPHKGSQGISERSRFAGKQNINSHCKKKVQPQFYSFTYQDIIIIKKKVFTATLKKLTQNAEEVCEKLRTAHDLRVEPTLAAITRSNGFLHWSLTSTWTNFNPLFVATLLQFIEVKVVIIGLFCDPVSAT